MKKKIKLKDMMKEVEELEPKNVIDFILQGSGLNQFLKKHGIMPKLPIPKR